MRKRRFSFLTEAYQKIKGVYKSKYEKSTKNSAFSLFIPIVIPEGFVYYFNVYFLCAYAVE